MSVKYVLIPAADDSAITELELAIPPTLEVACRAVIARLRQPAASGALLSAVGEHRRADQGAERLLPQTDG